MLDRKAFTIGEFCDANRISRSTFYNLKRAGRGPREMHVGGRIIISPQANEDWRAECEKGLWAEMPSEHQTEAA